MDTVARLGKKREGGGRKRASEQRRPFEVSARQGLSNTFSLHMCPSPIFSHSLGLFAWFTCNIKAIQPQERLLPFTWDGIHAKQGRATAFVETQSPPETHQKPNRPKSEETQTQKGCTRLPKFSSNRRPSSPAPDTTHYLLAFFPLSSPGVVSICILKPASKGEKLTSC